MKYFAVQIYLGESELARSEAAGINANCQKCENTEGSKEKIAKI